ncbi:MAG TPA: gephyrin-like molybdotransferase Glp [Chloroflexota bacterium]|nr:gephyrin-like molybdotransferase Glp [Chloroflexota bacterium]
MVSVEEAIAIVLEHTPALPAEEISLDEALGRVLAEDIVARDDMPPFAASAVDGYAVIAADGDRPRRVISEIIAGRADLPPLEPGLTARIMTGAPLPAGADAVLMVEETAEQDGVMTTRVAPPPGNNVHARGQDVSTGQLVLAAGTVLGAPEVGLLATVGRARFSVFRRPVVAVLSTGDELIEPDQPLRPGAIRDSNRHTLLASIREAGGVPVSLGSVRDDEATQEAMIREGLRRADVVLTSGGVSVGSRDLIKPILRRIGTIHFGRVSFKPGKPTTFATVGEQLVFGLPGFPVSSLVSFEVFVRPALRKLQGYPRLHRTVIPVTLGHAITPSPDRPEYQRATVRWEGGALVARSTGAQRSSRLLSLVGANALLRIPPGTRPIAVGDQADALLTGEIVPAED